MNQVNATQVDMQVIADKLAVDAGLVASVEYPGYIAIPSADQASLTWCFGTANDTWMGDLMNDNGSHVFESIDTGVPSTETDAGVIAFAIAKALLGHG